MIASALSIPANAQLTCDLCIIGSGPAGISIAQELANTRLKLVMLESGGRRETASARDMLRGYASPIGSHEPLEVGRRRQFGGASVVWGGRCVSFDSIDFERRSWIPRSGWPIVAEEVYRYGARATELCEAGRPVFDATSAFPDRQSQMILGFDGADVVTSLLERWGPPTDFAKRYGPMLHEAPNVRVLLNATAIRLAFEPNEQKVCAVQVASAPTSQFSVSARRVVLACGGLENARLLLASNDVLKTGLGNETGNVGRFYMSHLTGGCAWARLRDPGDGFIYRFEKDMGVYVRRRFWISPEAQRREQIANSVAFFLRPFQDELLRENALISATFLAKFALSLRSNRGNNRAEEIRRNRKVLLRHLGIVARRAPSLAPHLLETIKQRYFSKRRLPILLPSKEGLNNRFDLFYQIEQAPNAESRIVMHPERDALGMPRLEVRIAFSDVDVRTVITTHDLIRNQFARTGTGELVYDPELLEHSVRKCICNFDSNAHHIGTTRMSLDPTDGVVDKNCRVHGTENLFVAGSSVFPTSSHANPTLTIVALALRLADHLKRL